MENKLMKIKYIKPRLPVEEIKYCIEMFDKKEATKPSYEEWLNRFYEKPQTKLVFKARHDGKKYIEDELIKKYRKAFKCC